VGNNQGKLSGDSIELETLVDKYRPTSILIVGSGGKRFIADYLNRHPDCRVDALDGDDILKHLDSLGKYDLALVSHVLEHMDKVTAGMLISKLRDLHSARLVMLVAMEPDSPGHLSHWHEGELFGYGLVHIGALGEDDAPMQIYAFDIATYKITPDWLNSKYWANPELFGKYWW